MLQLLNFEIVLLWQEENVVLQKSFPCHIPWPSQPRNSYQISRVKPIFFPLDEVWHSAGAFRVEQSIEYMNLK